MEDAGAGKQDQIHLFFYTVKQKHVFTFLKVAFIIIKEKAMIACTPFHTIRKFASTSANCSRLFLDHVVGH